MSNLKLVCINNIILSTGEPSSILTVGKIYDVYMIEASMYNKVFSWYHIIDDHGVDCRFIQTVLKYRFKVSLESKLERILG